MKAFLAVRTGRQGGWRSAWRPVSTQARRAGRLLPLLVLLHCDQLRSSSVATQHFRLSFFRCWECGRQKSLFWSLWGGAVLPGLGFSVDQEGLPTTVVIAAGWGMIVHRSSCLQDGNVSWLFMSQQIQYTEDLSSKVEFPNSLGVFVRAETARDPSLSFLLPVEGLLYYLATLPPSQLGPRFSHKD